MNVTVPAGNYHRWLPPPITLPEPIAAGVAYLASQSENKNETICGKNIDAVLPIG